jgi:hypothetical protein
MDDWLGPAGWTAIFTGFIGLFTGMAAGVGMRQLTHIARPAQLEGLRLLYTYFDDDQKRDLQG